jgi:fatty acid desaturase
MKAPNHKGMPLILPGKETDFLTDQIITARNVRPNFLTDFIYGGLNYQIEHYLFPTLPRYHLPSARKIIKNFCLKNSLPYHEVGPMETIREIYKAFYQLPKATKAELKKV